MIFWKKKAAWDKILGYLPTPLGTKIKLIITLNVLSDDL
jgi:hypothetical protein